MRNRHQYTCSIFDNIQSTKPKTIEVLPFILDPPKKIRELKNELLKHPYNSEAQNNLKKLIPAITPSSVMQNGRGQNYITNHSGFIQFDLDKLNDTEATLTVLKTIPYVAYASKSIRNKGVWGLVEIQDTSRHKEHYDALIKCFENLNLKLDTTVKNQASLRVLSCDTDAYFNSEAHVFDLVLQPVKKINSAYTKHNIKSSFGGFDNFNKTADFDLIHNILLHSGWQYYNSQGARVRYTRPDKQTGISADYHTDRKTFYIFSDNAPNIEYFKPTSSGGYAGSASDIVIAYAANGDKTKAIQIIKTLNN